MNIKITKIITEKEPFQPFGKTYKVFSWIVNGEINGIIDNQNIELKAFKPQTITEGIECEVEMQDYLGNITYKILKVKKPQTAEIPIPTSQTAGTGYSRNSYVKGQYTLAEYDDLFNYAWNLFELRLSKITDPYHRYECLQKLISTFIISAVQIGIKAPEVHQISNNTNNQRQKLLVGEGVAS